MRGRIWEIALLKVLFEEGGLVVESALPSVVWPGATLCRFGPVPFVPRLLSVEDGTLEQGKQSGS
jgi:hypothetical protein